MQRSVQVVNNSRKGSYESIDTFPHVLALAGMHGWVSMAACERIWPFSIKNRQNVRVSAQISSSCTRDCNPKGVVWLITMVAGPGMMCRMGEGGEAGDGES